MRKVHRETLKIEDALKKPVVLTWREGSKILHVDYKTWGHIDFWLEVNDDVEVWESRAFQVYPTGDDVHPDATYVATSVQRDTDDLGFTITAVWHVYEHQIPSVEG